MATKPHDNPVGQAIADAKAVLPPAWMAALEAGLKEHPQAAVMHAQRVWEVLCFHQSDTLKREALWSTNQENLIV